MRTKKKTRYSKERRYNKYLIFSGLAFEMAAIIVGGAYLGRWLDAKFNHGFWLISLSLLAIFMSLYLVFRSLKNLR